VVLGAATLDLDVVLQRNEEKEDKNNTGMGKKINYGCESRRYWLSRSQVQACYQNSSLPR
jgi:hypothetical protein